MTATAEAIAQYTNDGNVITASSAAVLTADPNAIDGADNIRETFFDNATDAQVLLDEWFAMQSMLGRPHEGIEVDDSLGLGTTVPLWPGAPRATVIDDTRDILALTAVRAYSSDGETDSYAIEVVGIPLPIVPGGKVTVDSTLVTVDTTKHSMDER